MKCYIVKELLPAFIDGLTCKKTNADITAHLEECSHCRRIHAQMTAPISEALPEGLPNTPPPNFLQKLRGRIFRRNVTAAVLSLVVALVAVLIFAHQWRVPITFDANRMFVEIRDEVVVQSPTGEISWAGTAWLFPPEYTVLHTRETAYFAWQNFGNTGTNARGRDLYRDGERVRVVFIHKTETLWDSLFFNIEAVNWSNGGSFTGTSIYGDDFQTAHPTPKRIEIYYLPVRNIVRLGNLSDESFDAQRANATRIWAGTN